MCSYSEVYAKKVTIRHKSITTLFYTIDKGVSAFSRCTLSHAIGMALCMTVYALFRVKNLTILDTLL